MKRFPTDPRAWLVGGGIAGLLIFAVGWLLLIGPQRAAMGDLDDQTTQSHQQSDLLRARVAALKAKSADSARYAATLQQVEAALPYDSGLPAFTRQLNAAARAAGVKLNGLEVGGVTPVQPTAVTPAGASTPAAGTSGTTTTPTAAAVGGLFSLRVTVTTKGSMSHQLAFLRAIRSGPRRALVNGTQFGSAGAAAKVSLDRSSSLTTDVTVFSAPQPPEQVAQVHQLVAGLAR